jgi:Pro-kumamolisin, activation domain/Putative Ig domain/Subtilase family
MAPCPRNRPPPVLVALIALASIGPASAGAALLRVPAHARGRAAGTAGRPREVRLGSAPRLPPGTQPLAGVAAATPMRIAIALRPRHARALATRALAVASPGSPAYREYLSRARFARDYAPTARTVAAVDASLRAHGLSPGRRSANGLSIPVRASAGLVERAFSLTLARVELPGGARATVNTSAPALASAIAPAVQAVVGLSSLARFEPALAGAGNRAAAPRAAPRPRIASPGPQPCAAASGAAARESGLTAAQIAAAYAFTGLYRAGDEGAGATIAIYELEPDDPSDIAAYQACYGTHSAISYVEVDGGSRPASGAGSGEAALDIEQAIGLSPGARLLVYQGPNANDDDPGSGPYDTFSAIVSQDRAQVVSNSWGQCEPLEGRADAQAESVLFEEAALQGQTVVSAAGDDGSEDCYAPPDSADTELAVDDPASQPFVTGVGGTSLATVGPPPSETAWNSAGEAGGLGVAPGAGGGGVSTLWTMPAYQATAPASLGVLGADSSGAPCGAAGGWCREVPDVSADADPLTGYVIYYNGSGAVLDTATGWQVTGGTSAAAPAWAALFALADASPGCAGSPVGFANPALYRAAAAGESTYFDDVRSGDNDLTGTAGGRYPAGPGYDMATGLGSPNASALVPALCAQSLRLADPGSQRTFANAPAALALAAGDAPGQSLSFSARGLPRGLRIDPDSGRISGRPSEVGVFRVSVTVADQSGAQRRVAFRWAVEGRPRVSRSALTGVAAGDPELALTLAAGRNEPGLRALSLALPAGLRFAPGHAGVSVRNPRGRSLVHTADVRHGVLGLHLHAARSPLELTVAGGELVATRGLARAVARGRHVPTLTLGVIATDAAGGVSRLTLRLRPRS